jgi:transcriptional repressor NrdR
LYCPHCKHTDSRVIDSRVADDGMAIRRRRVCPECDGRFTTIEQIQLTVVKRSGSTEAFNRDKVIVGVRKACKGRPVSESDLALLAQRVEEQLRALGLSEIPSPEVGMAILRPLRELDEVAYMRFASVYRNFESLDDFAAEISLLNAERETSIGATPVDAPATPSRVGPRD